MPYRALTADIVDEVEDLDLLKEIFYNAIERIKKDGLFLELAGRPYKQKLQAEFWGVKYREISSARNHGARTGKAKYRKLFGLMVRDYRLLVDEKGNVISGKTNHQDPLRDLAGKLALNLIDVSTGFEETITDYSRILTTESLIIQRQGVEDVQRERYIAIVGAGASHAATLGKRPIPTAEEAIEALYAAFRGKVDDELLKAEVRRLSRLTRASEDDFETQLLALQKFGPDIVKEKLAELCGNANAPCLLYEVLAHMLKHRFLDAIINFNYDELLDSAIAEELPNPNHYRLIYTAGHCPSELKELYIDNRIKQPIYIKCHGTISQPNSLRFTQGQSFLIEEAIQDHIRELFKGEVPSENYEGQLVLNLLVIGFGMDNHILNQIIEDSVKEDNQRIRIWLFDHNPELGDTIQKRFVQALPDTWRNIEIIPIALPNEQALEKSLVKLWQNIDDCFKKPYKPQGIARHELISYVFQHISPLEIGPGSAQKPARIDYYRDRLYLELFILILKSNGIVHLSQVSDGRVGKYLELLYQEREQGSIHSYLKNIGMEVYERFMYDTYMIGKESFGNQDFIINRLRKRLNDGDLLSGNTRGIIKKNTKRFQDLCEGVLMRRLLKVNPRYVHKHDHFFSYLPERHVMNTSFAWIYNYRRNIEERTNSWDVMLTVTEEGGFLYGDIDSPEFKDKFFEVIVATYGTAGSSSKAAEKLAPLNFLSKLRYRPWWLHNKHLVLLLKRKPTTYTGDWEQDWKLVEGYFYRHTMLSQRVNPVKITHPRDLRRLLFIFAIYWHGARAEPSAFSSEDAEMGIVATKDQIEKIIKDMLFPYESKSR